MYAKSNATPKHFLELDDYSSAELNAILDMAIDRKTKKPGDRPCDRLSIATLFDKRSLRTDDSFDAGIFSMGGNAKYHDIAALKLGEKESIEHVAGTLSQYFSGITIRVSQAQIMREMARFATIPVINAMTNESHPCQIMADMMTLRENFGTIEGKKVVAVGDVNSNVLMTYQQAAEKFGFNLELAGPKALLADMPKLRNGVRATSDIMSAVSGADVVVTDIWTSMGQEGKDESMFHPFQVNTSVMAKAKPNALFMHCMPISPCYSKEVTAEVLKTPNSVILQQAANRMYAQNAILLHCLR